MIRSVVGLWTGYHGAALRSYHVKVPEGRLFPLGDHWVNSRDCGSSPRITAGRCPCSVRGRVTGGCTAPMLLAVGALVGILAGLTGFAGLGLGIAALALRQRKPVPAQPLWMAPV
ncbi:hypothetical protein [Streptomyces cellulosae]|uniref:hypothetical protein n=1 Tax=Streptomyces cellulosae TaxID=1968 RepID=UPI00068FAF6D|nr:hypothetical protein [Streptomyces cellulosae]